MGWPLRFRVLECLEAAPGRMTAREVAEEIGVSYNAALCSLRYQAAMGRVSKHTPRNRNGVTFGMTAPGQRRLDWAREQRDQGAFDDDED